MKPKEEMKILAKCVQDWAVADSENRTAFIALADKDGEITFGVTSKEINLITTITSILDQDKDFARAVALAMMVQAKKHLETKAKETQ